FELCGPHRDLHSFPTRRSSDLAEIELLEHHRGPFVEFLSELGVWAPQELLRHPVEVGLLFRGHLCSHKTLCLFVHANYVDPARRSEEHTSELQSRSDLVCRLLL